MQSTKTFTAAFSISAILEVPVITVKPDAPLTVNKTNVDFLFDSVRARFEQTLLGIPGDPQINDAVFFHMIAESAAQCAQHAIRVQHLSVPRLAP